MNGPYTLLVSVSPAEATLQAQGAQKERVCGQLAQRLQAAGETIAAHEQAARGLTQEMQAVCADNAAREGMCGALMGDLESANATIAAHEQAANNLKAYLAQLQDRNVQLGALCLQVLKEAGFVLIIQFN